MSALDKVAYSFQIANLVLKNLDKVDDLEFSAEVVKFIEHTTCDGLKVVWDYCSQFTKDHKKYPDWELIKSKFGDFIEEVNLDWSPDFSLELITSLKREAITSRASTLMAEGNLEAAGEMLSSLPTTAKKARFAVTDVIAEYNKIISAPSGVMTGIKEIDDDLKGMSYGTVTVFGAPPSQFKTSTMNSVLYNATHLSGFNSICITLEVKKEHLWFHQLSRHSYNLGNKIPAQLMIKGLLSDDQSKFLNDVLVPSWVENCKGVLEILDASDFEAGMGFSGMTREFLRIDAEMVKKKGQGLDIIWLDYIQLMKFYRGKVDPDQFLNDVVRYFGNISVTFKGRGLIIALNSQINRDGEKKLERKKGGSLTMLAEVNELERTGNAVVILHSDKAMRLANQLMIQLVKNRNGKVQAEMLTVYVDPECNLIGASDFSSIFSQDSIEKLGISGGDDDDIF